MLCATTWSADHPPSSHVFTAVVQPRFGVFLWPLQQRGAGVRGLEGSKLEDSLDFFFQVGATQVDAATLAVMAGTLANGGKCPTTDT